jgi:hypothetical protein
MQAISMARDAFHGKWTIPYRQINNHLDAVIARGPLVLSAIVAAPHQDPQGASPSVRIHR